LTLFRKNCLLLLLLSALVFFQANAWADEVTVAGSTTGCFSSSCPGINPLGGLRFTGISFGPQTTVGGFASLTNLGTFSLSNTPYDYNGATFTLDVTFSVPTGISGGGDSTFTASLLGAVQSTSEGGVWVNFDNSPQYFSFNDGVSAGTFGLSVNDVSLSPNTSITLSGNVSGSSQGATVPESGSLQMLASGLLITGGLLRRKIII
jgi:hypothetical protein